MSCGPDLRFGELTESRAEVALVWSDAARFQEVTATLHGPHCQFARTLPVEFAFDAALKHDGQFITRTVVTEPCYWTAELPFLYDLEVSWKTARDARCRFSAKIGLRRWEAQGQSFYLNRRRTVLRGAIIDTLNEDLLGEARAADASLLTPPPTRAVLEGSRLISLLPEMKAWPLAEQIGIPLVIDLREVRDHILSVITNLSWYASALLVIVNAEQIPSIDVLRVPSHLTLALGLELGGHRYPHVDIWQKKVALPDWTSAIAVDLSSGERPAPWLAHCGKPVIAIRRGGTYADLHEARAACDRLQAELAPEFDLAGYFV